MAKIKLILVAVIFLGVVGYLMFSGFQEMTVYYHTVGEVVAGNIHQSGKGIRVSGTVVPGSIQRQTGELAMDFRLADDDPAKTIIVHYKGVIPDNFQEGKSVVVEGTYNPDTHAMQAGVILVKCPSKYEKKS